LQNFGKEELYRKSSSLLPADAKNKEKSGKKSAERIANISCRAFSVAKEEEEQEEEKLCRFVNRNRFVLLQLLQQSSASTIAFNKSLLATTTTTLFFKNVLIFLLQLLQTNLWSYDSRILFFGFNNCFNKLLLATSEMYLLLQQLLQLSWLC
jgi:hypothetical protein